MTPGPRILFLDGDLPVEEIIDEFRRLRHPRIPVYQGHWDNVIGFIHSEDIMRIVRGVRELSEVTLDMILKPAHFVPPTKKVDEMFDYFQHHNTRVAIILGEYGEVLGIVTMKDVLTFIFGEISGKMVGTEYYEEEDENSYTVPGDMRLTDFNNLTNFDIEDPVMATIGGVAFRLYDRLPLVGDKASYEGFEFTVKELKGLRISKIKVQKMSTRQKPEADTAREQVISDKGDTSKDLKRKSAPDDTQKRKKKKKNKKKTKVSDKQITEKQKEDDSGLAD
jgi:CBS domain containing-hemolysin-like protein